jgi:hypothetical protein
VSPGGRRLAGRPPADKPRSCRWAPASAAGAAGSRPGTTPRSVARGCLRRPTQQARPERLSDARGRWRQSLVVSDHVRRAVPAVLITTTDQFPPFSSRPAETTACRGRWPQARPERLAGGAPPGRGGCTSRLAGRKALTGAYGLEVGDGVRAGCRRGSPGRPPQGREPTKIAATGMDQRPYATDSGRRVGFQGEIHRGRIRPDCSMLSDDPAALGVRSRAWWRAGREVAGVIPAWSAPRGWRLPGSEQEDRQEQGPRRRRRAGPRRPRFGAHGGPTANGPR